MKFNVPDDVKFISKVFKDNDYDLYLVGGCVRDMMLGKQPHDWDLCTNARPDDITELFSHVVTTGIAYGTVTVMINNTGYEITTYRSDKEYSDGRHPDKISFCNSILEDLSRRDFTINAMAYDIDSNVVVSLEEGAKDIAKGIIRCVGDPDKRFSEDALRILRALRFSITLGFDIEEKTFESMLAHKDKLRGISKERITDEFRKIFSSNMPVFNTFNKAHEILFQIIPELASCYKFNQNNKYHKHDIFEHILAVVDGCDTNDFVIKLAALYHDIGKPEAYTTDDEGHGHFYGHPAISKRIFQESAKNNLRLTREEFDRCSLLVEKHDIAVSVHTRYIHKLLVNYGEPFIKDFIILKRADLNDHIIVDTNWGRIDDFEELFYEVLEKESVFSLKDLAINGRDLMSELNLKEGKQIGHILNRLLTMVVNKEIENNKDALLTVAKEVKL